MAEKKGIQSLERAFSIIEIMTTDENESSVSDLARKTGLNKTTVFRMLDTLANLGYVSKNQKTEKYSLTLKFLKISAGQLANYDIHKKCALF